MAHSPDRVVLQYFVDKMAAAGYSSDIGYSVPDLARSKQKNNKPRCELWLSGGSATISANGRLPHEKKETVELYVFRAVNSSEDAAKWYDDCHEALNAFVDNDPERANISWLGWESTEVSIDRHSPLRRWDNSVDYGPGWFCVRFDLQVDYLTTIPV